MCGSTWSNPAMTSAFSTSIVRIALVLFFLNATSAFGACCLLPTESDAVAQTPCHQVDNSANKAAAAEPSGDCCLVCLPMLQGANNSKLDAAVHNADVALDHHTAASAGVDPPFRPPIENLS